MLLGGESSLYLPGFLASLTVVALSLWLGSPIFEKPSEISLI